MYRTIFLLWFIWSWIPQSVSQEIDSLKTVLPNAHDTLKAKILQKIAFEIVGDEPQVAIAYFNKSRDLAKVNRLNRLEVEALSGLAYGYELLHDSQNVNTNYLAAIELANFYRLENIKAKQHIYYGNYLNMTSNVLLAIDHYQKAASIYETSRDTINIIDTNMRIANAYDTHGDYVEALKRNVNTFELAKAFNDTLGMANLLNNMAIIFKKQNKVDVALSYYQKSIDVLETTEFKYQKANTTVNIALILKDKNQLDSALHLMHRSLLYFKSNKKQFGTTLTYHNIGVVHQKNNKIDSAIFYFNKSQALARKNRYLKTKIQNHLAIAEIRQGFNQNVAAIQHSDSAILVSQQLGSLEDLRAAYDMQYRLYEKQGNINEAFKSLKLYQSIHDSIFSDTKKQQIDFLKSQAELNQKEQELAIVAQEAEIAKLQKANAKNWNYVLIIGVIALMVITCLLLISRNNKVKTNRQLEEKSTKVAFQHSKIEKQQKKLLKKNKRLKKLNDDKNQLIGMVAHDLRSPLNQIRGLINILKLTDKLSHEGQEIMDKIAQSTDRLREMINRTLDLKAIESNKISLKNETFDLVQLISSVADNFVDLAKEKDIQIEKQLFIEDCFVNADKNYTIQILENLISNAIKFSPNHGLVAINIQTEGLKLNISVSDTGPGILKKDKKKLFKPFQKLTAKPTNNEDSSGLGLAIVKKYTEAMGGMIGYHDNPGGGSCFTVSFTRETVIDALSA